MHPSIPGHKLIAGALADEMVRLGIVRPSPDWAENRERRYAEHEASLDDFYFAKGQERLERLRLWTQGKADRVRPTPGSPQPPPNRTTDAPGPAEDNRHARGSP